jgi:hypothetical protein
MMVMAAVIDVLHTHYLVGVLLNWLAVRWSLTLRSISGYSDKHSQHKPVQP